MDESEASYGHDLVHEHRTTRANNIYLINDVRESGHTLRTSGSSIEAIREESRCIWMFDGTPGIFFDLEQSETFNRMCADEKPLELEAFLFMKQDLSLDDADNPVDLDFDERSVTIEENINTSIQNFQSEVMKRVSKTVAHTSNSFGGQPYPVVLSGTILKELEGLIHRKEFLIQQNRDLYRELCDHSCRGMRDSSQATFIRTKWCQDLNDSLDTDTCGISHGVNTHILADVIEQLILNLKTQHRMDIERDKNKVYRKYTRGVVKKARDEMKQEIKIAWRTNMGDDEEIVKKRDKILNDIQKDFHYKTDWAKMKFDFDLVEGGGVNTSEDKQRIHDAKQGFKRNFKENEEQNELARQKIADEMAQNSEKRARERKHQQNIDELQRKQDMEIARKNVVPNSRSIDKGSFDKRYTPFVGYLRTKYKDQINEPSMQRNLANKCEEPCVNELISFLNNPLSVPFIREDVRKSMQNMHEKIYNEMLQGNLDVSGEDQEYIKYYFDSRVYEKINGFEFQEADATKSESRKNKKGIILDEFHIIMKNHMDKYYELAMSNTILSPLNYNPYVI